MYALSIYVWLCNITMLPCGLEILTVVPSLTFSLAYFSAKLTQDILQQPASCRSNQIITLLQWSPVAPLYPRVHSPPWYAQTGSTREWAPCVATLIISREGMGLKDVNVVALLLVLGIGNSESHYVTTQRSQKEKVPVVRSNIQYSSQRLCLPLLCWSWADIAAQYALSYANSWKTS